MKSNKVLFFVVLLAYWAGLCNASAFYEPGAQRWVNRDPINEIGFDILSGKYRISLKEEQNLYAFIRNSPLTRNDIEGLAGTDPTVPGAGSFLGPGIAGGILEVIKALRICSQLQPGDTVYALTPASALAYLSPLAQGTASCACNGKPFIFRTKIYKDANGDCHWGGVVIICLGPSGPPEA